ncbi:MAG: hypothetical protein ABIF19_18055 [Planctomycetota bacterium]
MNKCPKCGSTKFESQLSRGRNDLIEYQCGRCWHEWNSIDRLDETIVDQDNEIAALRESVANWQRLDEEKNTELVEMDKRIAYLESENKALERELEAAHRSFAEVIDHVNGYNEDLAMIFVDHRLERMEQARKEVEE